MNKILGYARGSKADDAARMGKKKSNVNVKQATAPFKEPAKGPVNITPKGMKTAVPKEKPKIRATSGDSGPFHAATTRAAKSSRVEYELGLALNKAAADKYAPKKRSFNLFGK